MQQCALGAMAFAAAPVLRARDAAPTGAASRVMPLESDWLFGGQLVAGATEPGFNDAAFTRIALPHAVNQQSWQNWNVAEWQHEWIYRRHFTVPEDFKGLRVFLHFDGVMVGATPTLNGHALPQHLGGYLPFSYEVSNHLVAGENVLAVVVDGRWSNVPPDGAAVGPRRVDYLEMSGIHRGVRLTAVPAAYLADVFAKPVKVLDADRRVEVACTIDAAAAVAGDVQVEVELRNGATVLSRTRRDVRLDKRGEHTVNLTLTQLGNITLWDSATPQLYTVVTTLLVGGKPVHDHQVRIGFREARFEVDGFFLNGRRLRLFGLNRHEIYPYIGFAMPPRVKRRDAEILRRDFNCNIVRCSHYPQDPAFLDACDELGLMVWEEIPGWGYLGDDPWRDLMVRDVKDMIVRDRNRPSVVIWGTRVNESANDATLYRRTRALAKSLDDSRPTSGSMTSGSRRTWETEWAQDVFAMDDYHADPDGTVGIDPPLPGVPYFLAEAVGQFNYTAKKNFDSKYRRAGEVALQAAQAIRHAQAHSKAAAHPRMGGVIAWCGFDYSSLVNPYNNLKCPGVADGFRIPKLGATFYLAQGDPKTRPVIAPNFYWDFGPQTPRGPGKGVAIFSNCERLELFINGARHAAVEPDAINYPHLAHPPFFVDLELDGATRPDLRIDGYVSGQLALSRSFASDSAHDQLAFKADDAALSTARPDGTRLEFQVVDKFGARRAFGGGTLSCELSGPGELVGDNPFSLAEAGGGGALWLRALPGRPGRITVRAHHSQFGERTVTVEARADVPTV